MAAVKPPNIFVCDGLESATENYNKLKTLLQDILDLDCYTINHLAQSVLSQNPWEQYTMLLIVTSNVDEACRKKILEYVHDSGSLLLVDSALDQEFVCCKAADFDRFVLESGDLVPCAGKRVYIETHGAISLGNSSESPVIVHIKGEDGADTVVCSSVTFNTEEKFWRTCLSALGLESRQSSSPKLAPIYVFSILEESNAMQEIVACLTKKMAGESFEVPVHTQAMSRSFDLEEYRTYLETRTLGKVLLFTEVIGSTNDTLEGIMCQVPDDAGLTMVAGCQIKGRGRSGNTWISPKGSALFSFLIKIPISSKLGKSISCVQHLAALAIVIAFKNHTGCHGLKIKWPNDIYTKEGQKVGGILSKSSVFLGDILCVIGCGVNVCNEKPTVCINDLLQSEHKKISVEILIASALTEFERLQNTFEIDNEAVFKLYYDNWLHTGQKVTLKSGGIDESVEIISVDEFGYLLVRNEKGEIRSVHPDGNSLDMMHGLVYTK